MIFKNVGAAGGASLEHSHSQLIVTPIVPVNVWEEMTGSLEFYQLSRPLHLLRHGSARARRREADRARLDPLRRPSAPSPAGFRSRPGSCPRLTPATYENIPKTGRGRPWARAQDRFSTSSKLALDKPAYNYIIHTAPFDHTELPHYHWHIEVIPRLTKVAGFEWGTGFYINPVPPEHAAGFLREIEVGPPQASLSLFERGGAGRGQPQLAATRAS